MGKPVGLAPKGNGSSGRTVVGLAPAKSDTGRRVVGLAPTRSGGQSAGASVGGSSGGHQGFLHRLGSDLLNVAENAPAGIVEINKSAALDIWDNAHGKKSHRLEDIAGGTLKQVKKDMRHPLRHPGLTALDVLPVFGAVGKAAEAGRVAKAGGTARDVAKAAVHGTPHEPRVLKVGGLEVKGQYSRAAGARMVQRGVDKALTKGAEKSVRVEDRLHKRAAKWEQRRERVIDAVERTPGTRVAALGAKLKPHELRALRIVAEEVPVERRVAAQELRKARAKGKEVGRHQERIDLTRAAMEHLTSDSEGRPVFKPEATKLQRVYHAMTEAVGSREKVLEQLNLMDREAQQAAKTKVGRLAAGEATTEGALPLTYGTHSIADMPQAALEKRLASIDGDYNKLVERAMGGKPGDYRSVTALQNGRLKKAGHPTVRNQLLADAETAVQETMRRNAEHPTVKALQKRLDEADQIRAELQRRGDVAVGLAEGRKGAEAPAQFQASPDATFIGNPRERTKVRGVPRVSSTGTFGHTQKPSSLKQMTGSSVEHALERNDVTNIVAERQHEAVRLGKIQRVAQRMSKAGETTPRRKDDVWVWTDKTVSQEKIPPEVRKYLDNPESIKSLPAEKQVSLTEQLKAAFLEKHDWQSDAEAKAKFEQYAKEGKGAFVPRRLLGDLAKTDYAGATTSLGHAADVVNNAQKAALVYMKLNYPIVQALSNTAMNLIQQGPFAVKNLTNAFKLDGMVGPEYSAVIDDIMGQGAVLQAAFEGQGAVARGTQKLAHVMSSKVDTPARRSAFLHEAAKKGYKTGDELVSLLTDEANVDDLVEAAQKAKEAIVDYGDLSPFERKVVRKLIFVYPWQKGAVKYAGHFLRDHPVQAAALGMVGEQGTRINAEKIGDTPSYLRGAFDVGGGLVNPSGVNFFQTPGQIGEAAAGLATGSPAQRGAGLGFLAPAPAVLAGLLSGHDDIGRPLTSNLPGNLRDLTYGQSQAAAVIRALGHDYSPIRKGFGSRTNSQTFPNSNDAFARFLLGGLYPRDYSKPALHENAARQRAGR